MDQASLVVVIVPLSVVCLAEAGLLIYQILLKLKKRKLFSVVPVFMLGIFSTGQIVTTAILSVFMIGMAAANIVLFVINRKQKRVEDGSAISENSMAPVTDDNESSLDFETEELEGTGVEVIAVAWPEHPDRLYCYDPNGYKVHVGDVVLVPSKMLNRSREIQREATVVRGNYRVEPETIHYPLKKIVCVAKRKS